MKKKLNLIKLQKEEIKEKGMSNIRGGGLCGCFDDGTPFNRVRKRDNDGVDPIKRGPQEFQS